MSIFTSHDVLALTPASDANIALTAIQSGADTLVVATGAWASGHLLTSARNPVITAKQRIINNTPYVLTFAWASGTAVSVGAGHSAVIGNNGTNAIFLSYTGLSSTGTGPSVFGQDPAIAFAAGNVGDNVYYTGTQVQRRLPREYGPGSDGAVTDTGASQWFREYYMSNWTMSGACAVDQNANPAYVNGVWDITGAPAGALVTHALVPGNNAAVNVAGAATLATYLNTLYGGGAPANGIAGAAGATAAGTANGTSTLTAQYMGGGAGATGAAGTGNAGANAPGAAIAPTVVGNASSPHTRSEAQIVGGVHGTGGPSGGGDGTASGGGGGGACSSFGNNVYARQVNRSSSNANAGVIQAKGNIPGNGGIPSAGNRGGGAPGVASGGACFRLVCEELLGTAHTNCVDVSGANGGNAGTGTGTGTNGTGSGASYGGQLVVYAGATCTVTSKRAVGGNAASGTTGGTVTAGQCNL